MKLERLDTPNGRFYRTPSGIFPSVTTVLSSLPNPELEIWRNAVGPIEAEKVSKRATTRGTRLHSYCEDYLAGKRPKLDIFDREAYKGLSSHLDRINPISVEEMSYSSKLKIAGTMDCLGYYDNELCLIDFKTTGRQKYDGEFDRYYLQCAAYTAMVYEHRGLIVPNLLIIMQNLDAGETQVFKAKSKNFLPKMVEICRDFHLNQK